MFVRRYWYFDSITEIAERCACSEAKVKTTLFRVRGKLLDYLKRRAMHYEKTDWIDVIGKIDPAYVKEAEQWSKAAQKKRNLKHFTAMAACVCILLAGAVVSFDLWVQNKNKDKCCAEG